MVFYEPGQHREVGLSHNPFKAIVVPRPIGWISVVSSAGALNLSPYSFFNAFLNQPPLVGFSSEGRKDAVTFAEETGEFVCNFVSFDLMHEMSLTSAPLARGESEFAHAGLATAPSRMVKPPRVAAAHAALECKVTEIRQLKDMHGASTDAWLVLGQVVGVHIDDRFIKNGLVDTAAMQPVARLGYKDYSVVNETVTLARPSGGGD